MPLIDKLLKQPVGSTVELEPDHFVITDGPGHDVFDRLDFQDIKDKHKTVIIFDHDIPAGNFESARIQKELIEIARKGDLRLIQSRGIGYQLMIDEIVQPGQMVVSCGEHNSVYGTIGALGMNLTIEEMVSTLKTGKVTITVPEAVGIRLTGRLNSGVTAKDVMLQLTGLSHEISFIGKSLEFYGPALKELPDSSRTILCTLAGRTGAICGFINESGCDEEYEKTLAIGLGSVTPVAALPGDLNTVRQVTDLDQTEIAAAFIGGCTGGSLEDLRSAAAILKGRQVATHTRLTIAPATNDVYLVAIEEGLIDIFIDSGAQILNPGCASCVTTSKGVVGPHESMVSASCYNYAGCNGHPDSKVYVVNPMTAAATALTGKISAAR